ncbi:TonB-dependent receptor, partial [bacterium]|nr:TonB-dependent receptor [bacterium]
KFDRRLVKASILFICAFFLTVSLSYAQRISGKLIGTVTDEGSAALPRVTVEISSPALMGGIHSQVTSDKGTFRFVNLPPGTYKIVCKLEGFQTVEKKEIKLLIGMTVTENISLKPKTIEEYITVTAASPVVDVTKSSTSTNYGRDQLEKLPLRRDYSFLDIIKQTPGFTTTFGWASSIMSAYGSNPEENATFMDGVDIGSPETGTAWLWPAPDMFEEVEVSGIGAPAEYGNFTGAVVNIVTKSGGNKFSGTASYYGQFQKLTDDNNPDPYDPATETGLHSYNRVKFYDIAFTLGGPIIKDKIWFFSLYQKQHDSESQWQDDPEYQREIIIDEQFLKISTQITDKHRLVLSFDREHWYLPGFSPSPWNLPETICAETYLSYAWNAHYTWLISNNSFIELKYSGYYSPGKYMPAFGGNIHQPIHYDLATEVSSNGPWYAYEYIVTRHQVNAAVSYF